MSIIRFLCVLIAARISQACRAEAPTLTIQGEVYKSACVPAEQSVLKQQLADAAGHNHAEDLRSVVVTVLCGKVARADEAMRRASDPHVKLTVDSTSGDQPSVTLVPRAVLKAYGGAAWGAYVDTSNDGVGVNFYKNEACMETLVFRSREKSWRLVAVVQACD